MNNKVLFFTKTNMKTFLWTTLFWIVAAIVLLLCLWFWNLWTQVLDNGWIANLLPSNIQTKVCDPVLSSALEDLDYCAVAQEKNCDSAVKENEEDVLTWDMAWIQKPLADIIENQQIIYDYLKESFANTNQSISKLSNISASVQSETKIIDEKEQKRLQLQSQIEALQDEMANL